MSFFIRKSGRVYFLSFCQYFSRTKGREEDRKISRLSLSYSLFCETIPTVFPHRQSDRSEFEFEPLKKHNYTTNTIRKNGKVAAGTKWAIGVAIAIPRANSGVMKNKAVRQACNIISLQRDFRSFCLLESPSKSWTVIERWMFLRTSAVEPKIHRTLIYWCYSAHIPTHENRVIRAHSIESKAYEDWEQKQIHFCIFSRTILYCNMHIEF